MGYSEKDTWRMTFRGLFKRWNAYISLLSGKAQEDIIPEDVI